MSDNFEFRSEVLKADAALGLVLGWGIVCKKGGEDYFDTQGDCIPEESMLEATTDFMKSSRIAGTMHARTADGQVVKAGTVVHSMPLTQQIADIFKLSTEQTGWMVAIAPDPGMLAKFKNGELTGFSIGGKRLEDEVIEN